MPGDRHLLLLLFEERRLDLGGAQLFRPPVDVREHWPGPVDERTVLWVHDQTADDVGREHVGGELIRWNERPRDRANVSRGTLSSFPGRLRPGRVPRLAASP